MIRPFLFFLRRELLAGVLVLAWAFGATACAPDGGGPNDRARQAAARVRPALERDLAKLNLAIGDAVFIRIFKEERVLEFWMRGRSDDRFRLFRTYPVVAMSGELGPKLQEGDRQAPEGFYSVAREQLHPGSRYHLAFNLGYPNDYDLAQNRTGSFLMVHGSDVSIGCFAMTDQKIEEIYTLSDAALTAGQPRLHVHIFPFRMTAARMRRARASRWFDFWNELHPAYRHFERGGVPPEIAVREKRYELK